MTGAAIADTVPETTESPDTQGTVGRLKPVVRLMRPMLSQVLLSAALEAAGHLATLASAFVAALLVGQALTGASSAELAPWLAVLVGLVVIRALLNWSANITVHRMSYRFLGELRMGLFRAVQRRSPISLATERSGDVATTAVADVEIIELFTSHILPPLLVALIVPVVCLAWVAIIDPLLALVLLPFVVAVATVPGWFIRRAERQGDVIQSEQGALGADVVEIIGGAREIAAFEAGDFVMRRVRKRLERHARATEDHLRRTATEDLVVDALLSAATLTVAVFASWLVAEGRLAVALLAPAVVLASGAFAPLLAVQNVGRQVNKVAAAAARTTRLLDAPAEMTDPAAALDVAVMPPSIRFEGVSFRYAPHLPLALDDVSFEIPAGGTIALVGASGAGKSTCAALLLRFARPESGRVLVGGTDVADLADERLRELVTSVPQEVYLFSASVADIVRLGRPDARDADVREAARIAQAETFVDALPDGWDTMLGERGTGISGGQRQRLAIARAVLRGCPVVILDEATSNLDTEADRQLQEAMVTLAASRTTLVIAHRPSTIRRAASIVVLEAGRVAEIGTWEELSTRDGALTRLLRTTGAATDR